MLLPNRNYVVFQLASHWSIIIQPTNSTVELVTLIVNLSALHNIFKQISVEIIFWEQFLFLVFKRFFPDFQLLNSYLNILNICLIFFELSDFFTLFFTSFLKGTSFSSASIS